MLNFPLDLGTNRTQKSSKFAFLSLKQINKKKKYSLLFFYMRKLNWHKIRKEEYC